MANHARGEADVTIGGRSFRLVLGLGVLAEIEDAFGVESYEEVFDLVFAVGEDRPMGAKRVCRYVEALLRGNGVVIDDDVRAVIAAAAPHEIFEAQRTLMQRAGMIAERPAAQEGGYQAPPSAGETDGSSGFGSDSGISG